MKAVLVRRVGGPEVLEPVDVPAPVAGRGEVCRRRRGWREGRRAGSLAHRIASREELLTRSEELFAMMVSGALKVRIGARYPLADASRAHEDLGGRRTMGTSLIFPAA